ncbi:hypothetical protein AVEN_72667-1 [Araneus ventricosus]|uniref:Uncharacterized protein n=1 Tax=Araneus ventricosus TaxID=182803 RepID=A0A4Y2L2G4_ARAVE|nr:hypothetical protein AVEN_72667-1 [Araneus ventricosus]
MKSLPFIYLTNRSEEKRGNGRTNPFHRSISKQTSVYNSTHFLRTLSSQKVKYDFESQMVSIGKVWKLGERGKLVPLISLSSEPSSKILRLDPK